MYTTFFNLTCNPFQLTPDPEFLFLSKEHKKALTYLRYGISSNTGFILVTGEIGTGKTTLIRQLLKELKKDIKVARVNNTLVNSEQLISMINDDFGIKTKGKDKTEMLRDLSDFIIRQYAQGFRTALIIDEAQNLSSKLLEEIRLLSNLETDKAKLLQIILAGQPELKQNLAVPELRQLRQRINISCHINPLGRDETEEYIRHRLEIAGNRAAVTFLDGALDDIYSLTRGIPRLINIFCDFLLLAAFTEETKEISASLIKEVAEDLDSENRYWTDTVRKRDDTVTAKPLQSIVRRLDNLEAAVKSQNSPRLDIEEINTKLTYLETVITAAIAALVREPQGSAVRSDNIQMQAILRDIEVLKKNNAELAQKEPSSAETNTQQKKTLRTRFSIS
jgi:putative secretion ATPase (PEP-CTERM system associated)